MGRRHDTVARVRQPVEGHMTRVPAESGMSGADLPPPTSVQIDTSAGPTQALIHRPGQEGVVPLLNNIHGGGYVLRNPEQDEHMCRRPVAGAGCTVLDPDYDTAPQHRYPAAPTVSTAAGYGRCAGPRQPR